MRRQVVVEACTFAFTQTIAGYHVVERSASYPGEEEKDAAVSTPLVAEAATMPLDFPECVTPATIYSLAAFQTGVQVRPGDAGHDMVADFLGAGDGRASDSVHNRHVFKRGLDAYYCDIFLAGDNHNGRLR